MKVENMKSARGNVVPNQFIVTIGNDVYFQSYESTIAKVDANGGLTLGKHFDYSKTTMRYLHQFLKEQCNKYRYHSKQELQKEIDNGNIKYIEKQNWL